MAPEQIEGKPADARSDIFAFGLVLYEMLTGRRAFQASSQAGLMASILKEEPPPLTTLLPSIPAALERTVRKCLAKEPERRWQTAMRSSRRIGVDRRNRIICAASHTRGGRFSPGSRAPAQPDRHRRTCDEGLARQRRACSCRSHPVSFGRSRRHEAATYNTPAIGVGIAARRASGNDCDRRAESDGLGSAAGFPHRAPPGGNRRRPHGVLVRERTIHRLLGQRQAAEDPRRRRYAGADLRSPRTMVGELE